MTTDSKQQQQQSKDKNAAGNKGKDKNAKKKEEELSEEDLQLKQELEMLTERVSDPDQGVSKLALNTLTSTIRDSTSSMTAVPKPLKFLRPHFNTLKQAYEKLTKDNQMILADILSMLSLAFGQEGARECLKYKLKGDINQIGVWGHEYVRHLAGEVGQQFQEDKTKADTPNYVPVLHQNDLERLIRQLCDFFVAHNSEPELCDLLIETERVHEAIKYADKVNYPRIGLYLQQCAQYLSLDYNFSLKDDSSNRGNLYYVCYELYRVNGNFPDAMRMALRLNAPPLMSRLLDECKDKNMKQQLAFILSRQQAYVDSKDELLNEIIGNNKLASYYQDLARDLHSLEAKTPEDIYKSHLQENRGSNLPANVDSARQNLAATYVNAFVNAGYGTDKLLTIDDNRWIFKNKDAGMLSAAASMGMLKLWDVDGGLDELSKFMYSNDANIKAGSLLGVGIVSCGVRPETDPAFALLSDAITGNQREVRISAIMGMGLAYAGTARSDILEALSVIVVDAEQPFEVVCFAGLALGLVYAGSCNEEVAGMILQVLMEREPDALTLGGTVINAPANNQQQQQQQQQQPTTTAVGNPLSRFLCVALGLLFLGKQESADAIIDAANAVNEKIVQYCLTTIETCAYAGTGNVLKVQKLLKLCGEHFEDQEKAHHQMAAVLGIALVAMGEDVGQEMAIRAFDHLLQYGDVRVKRAICVALGIISVSNPSVTSGIMDTLSRLSHDSDKEAAMGAIFSLGMIGAGTNHARIAQLLRQLAGYYARDPQILFVVRLAQGLLYMGKGLITMSPFHSGRFLLSPVAASGLIVVCHALFDINNLILGKYHYLLYHLVCAMYPRMLMLVDENLKPIATDVRVGTAVDTVAQAGRPKTITGFQTHKTPVLLQFGERAELATEQYLALSTTLEGVVIVKKNPDWVADL